MKELNEKIAIVTGATQGMGRGIALKLAEYGSDVVVSDMNLDGAKETAGMIMAIEKNQLQLNAI